MSEDKKPFNQIKYQNEYNKEKYDRISIMAPKGKKEEWKDKANAEGLSLSAWILKQIDT